MAPRNRLRGFTLIELLISMTVMSLVIALGTYAFSLFAKDWDGRSWAADRSIADYQRLDLVISAIRGALPWAVRDQTGAIGFYFLGRDEGVTFVTENAVFSDDGPALVRIFREAAGRQRWKLVYEEAPLSRESLRSADQVVPFKYRLIVFTAAQEIRFEFLGWDEQNARVADDSQGSVIPPRWWEEFDGLKRFHHPLKLRLVIDGHASAFAMPDRSDLIRTAIDTEF
jgi:prepilin-type N-terminal cleavage/methylation domain-containing protein